VCRVSWPLASTLLDSPLTVLAARMPPALAVGRKGGKSCPAPKGWGNLVVSTLLTFGATTVRV